MKIALALMMAVLTLGGCSSGNVEDVAVSTPEETAVVVGVKEGEVSIVIDDGESASTTSAELAEGMTAYDALELATDEQGLALEVTEYDFGILVDAVSDKPNTEENAWIYFVNGDSGNVGADQYELVPGDVLEWKYTEPIF